MDSTPSNGSDSRASTRQANTRTLPTGEPSDGEVPETSVISRAASAHGRSDVLPSSAVEADALPPLETYPAIAIEDVLPELGGGHWPIKRVVGDTIEVWADIFKEGHDLLQARVVYRPLDESTWREAPMRLVENDRWTGAFSVDRNT